MKASEHLHYVRPNAKKQTVREVVEARSAHVAANGWEQMWGLGQPGKEGLVFSKKARGEAGALLVVPIQGGGKFTVSRRSQADAH